MTFLLMLKMKSIGWRNIMSDTDKLKEIYNAIRQDEIKNVRTGKYDDKDMVDRIAKYLLKIARKEQEKQNED